MRVNDGRWFKSSRSGPNCDNCVEVAAGPTIGVRDSKDRGGPTLAFAPRVWQAFATAAGNGGLRRAGGRV